MKDESICQRMIEKEMEASTSVAETSAQKHRFEHRDTLW